MGPVRVITSNRGYLTETIFDAARQRFVEVPFPPQQQKRAREKMPLAVLQVETAVYEAKSQRQSIIARPPQGHGDHPSQLAHIPLGSAPAPTVGASAL